MLILDDAIFDNIWEHIYSALCHFFLLIASLIYKLANLVYQVFMAVASAKIFDSNDYQNFANKIYLVIGIVALFSLAYALLRGIVDPDSTSKDDMTVKKIVPNTLKAILLIAFVPTIFNFAYKMQDVILSQNVISNLFFDTDNLTTVQDTSFATAGSTMTNEIFLSFFMPNSKDEGDVCSNDNFDMDSCLSTVSVSFDSIDDFSKNYTQNGILNYTVPGFALGVAIIKTVTDKFENNDSITLKDAKDLVDQTGNFDIYTDFALNAAKGEINYNWLIQGIIGCIVIYVFLSFTIDMGIRAIKLAYYQIIAPIPIMMLILPNQKKIFDNWLKSTLSTFAEVFIRIFIVVFCIYMIQNLPDFTDNIWSTSLMGKPSLAVCFFARVFVIVGILIFMKQAPQLISDMFGLKSGSMKLGIGEKLGQMAFVGGLANKAQGAITGALGAGLTSKVNGGSFMGGAKYGAASGWKDGKGRPNQFNSQRQGLYSTLGYKGKAGIFGGQAYMDKLVDDTRNHYTDDYKDRILSGIVNSAENYTDSNSKIYSIYNDELSKRQQDNATLQADLSRRMDSIKTVFDAEKNNKINSISNEMSQTEAEFKNKFQKAMTAEEQDAIKQQYNAYQAKKTSELNDLKNSSYNDNAEYRTLNAQLQKAISDSKEGGEIKFNEYDPLTKKLKEVTRSVSKLEADSFDSAVKTLRDQDETFKNQEKVFSARVNEKATNAWLNSEDGLRELAVHGKTMERIQKGEKPFADAPKAKDSGSDKK